MSKIFCSFKNEPNEMSHFLSNEGLKLLNSTKENKPNNPIISYININSIRNKLTLLTDLVTKHVDILAIAETKLDESFPVSQFLIEGFKSPIV